MTHNRLESPLSITDTRSTFRSTRPGTAAIRCGLILSVFSALLLAAGPARAQSETVLYSFGSQSGDGSTPYAGLILDKQGTLYGTTYLGGANNEGTVFKLTPSGTETVLYSFQSAGLIYPYAGLVLDKHGNLYGTEPYGGENSQGMVLKFTTVGDATVLYAFGGQSGDGLQPNAGLVFDKQGYLYGTTVYGGANNMGTVFKLAPSGTETVLHTFGSQSGDGIYPFDGLVLDQHGNLYGTTYRGGANGYGAVFKVTPSGTETVLYSFGSQSGDGLYPFAGLVLDKQSDLYGTTLQGGANGYGAIFKVTPSGTETVLYSFGSQSGDGYGPHESLAFDKQGNLYGTKYLGGANGGGTVFKMTPSGTETVLYSFGSQSGDGLYPFGGLVFDKQGDLYGTTLIGGAYGWGTVFKLTP